MCRLRFVALTDYAIQCRPRWGLFPKADKGITDAARRRPDKHYHKRGTYTIRGGKQDCLRLESIGCSFLIFPPLHNRVDQHFALLAPHRTVRDSLPSYGSSCSYSCFQSQKEQVGTTPYLQCANKAVSPDATLHIIAVR